MGSSNAPLFKFDKFSKICYNIYRKEKKRWQNVEFVKNKLTKVKTTG